MLSKKFIYKKKATFKKDSFYSYILFVIKDKNYDYLHQQ
jgi:hypothetical protein